MANAVTTLFKKLYQNGKNIIKSWALDNVQRRAMIKIEGSITESKRDAYDLIEKQKEMLCDIANFDHIEFAKSMKTFESTMANLVILQEMMTNLFWVSPDIDIDGDVWQYIKEATQESAKEKKDESK